MKIMDSKKELLRNFTLYAITDLKGEDPKILKKIEGALRGGADILQLRATELSDRALYELGLEVRKLTSRYKKLLIMNDRVDLALAVGADGVHLGREDLSIDRARRIMKGRPILIGCSTHSTRQALAAQRGGADYIGVGPVFPTPTKPDYPAVGTRLIEEVRGKISIPFVAIGGIDERNIEEVLAAGATRVACVRAIFAHEDTFQATKRFREAIDRYIERPVGAQFARR